MLNTTQITLYYPNEVFFGWLAMWCIGGLMVLVVVNAAQAVETETNWSTGCYTRLEVALVLLVFVLSWPIAVFNICRNGI